jgi:hypothetical protein
MLLAAVGAVPGVVSQQRALAHQALLISMDLMGNLQAQTALAALQAQTVLRVRQARQALQDIQSLALPTLFL